LAQAASHSKHESQYFSVSQYSIESTMWNRIIGKSNDAEKDSHSQSSRRKENEQRSTRKRSGSIASSSTAQKSSRRDDRDPTFHPTPKNYSSTTRNTFTDTASASIASSYATASGNQTGEPYPPPEVARNASLTSQMPKSKTGRDEHNPASARERKSERRMERTPSPERNRDRKERRASRDRDERKRERRDRRDNKEKDGMNVRGLGEEVGGYSASIERTRGDFNNQIGEPGFMQFPGQNGAGFVGGPSSASAPMSAHVPDQFPGQFPSGIAEPYRPPMAVSEGGPGLAADYYGDTGESVAMQPGVRPQQPSLIVGAEPHLQPASSTVAPPLEPSATGHVGAAASFFSGDFESEAETIPSQYNPARPNAPSSSTFPTHPGNGHHTPASSAIPALGAIAAGAASGYYTEAQSTSHSQHPDHSSNFGSGQSFASQRPPSYVNGSYSTASHSSQPSNPGKQTIHSSNVPLYAAGAAGLAAAAYHHNHHSDPQYPPTSQGFASGSMAQRHRHRGPLAKFVDFFKDPEGVAQFEEYTEYIGVCRDCFEPGSTSRDAPRKHHLRSRRSSDRLGSSNRIDKDSRYSSSDSEKRRRKKQSWLEAGVAGYGLAKVGESLFNQKHASNDTYSVKSGYTKKSHAASSSDRTSYTSRGTTRRSSKTKSRRRDSSSERIETGIISDGRVYTKDSHGTRHRSRSRSRSLSKDRKAGRSEAALGAATGSSVMVSKAQNHEHPTEKVSVRRSHNHRERSPDQHRSSDKKERKNKKKRKGFFSFSSSTSSSSNEDLASGVRSEKPKRRTRRNSKDDHRKAELAAAGLGAAAAALALNETRRGNKSRRQGDLVAVKESKGKSGRGLDHRRRNKRSPPQFDEDPWESALDEDESINSDLAYGDSVRRRDSRSSLSSESSGTNKWGWRWGSKKKSRSSDKQERHDDPDIHHNGITMHSNSSIPLQQMYPTPMSDPSRHVAAGPGILNDPSHPKRTARPEPVPIQHPQPVTPVSSTVYSTQTPYEHAYSAPTGPSVLSQPHYGGRPSSIAPQDGAYEASSPFHIPGSFPEKANPSSNPFDNMTTAPKPRRGYSSPAAYDPRSSDRAVARKSGAPRNAPAAVRFNLSEEQAERDRRDRRRQAEEDRERKYRRDRRGSEDQKASDHDQQDPSESSRRNSGSKRYEERSERADLHEDRRDERSWPDKRGSWTSPIAAAGIASVVGAAIKAHPPISDRSNVDEVERRERRRRRREERAAVAGAVEETSEEVRQEGQPSAQGPETSVAKDLATFKRSSSHEDYREFFIPHELLSRAPRYKEEAAEADADHTIGAYEVPEVVTIEPRGFHDSREAPAYTFGPNGEEINPDPIPPPWVPKLKLIAPSPQPSSLAGSERGDLSPVMRPHDTTEDLGTEVPPPISTYTVITDDHHTPEYTIIEPKERRDEAIQSPKKEDSRNGPPTATTKNENSAHDSPNPTEPNTTSSTADFGDDLVFAATLAAGLEDAGLDPSIVVDDPSFRRRDSPPGTEAPGTYRRSFTHSVLDLSSDAPLGESDVPPQQGFVEGDLPESSMPGSFVEEEALHYSREPERKIGKKEKKKRDKKAKSYELARAPEQESFGETQEPSGAVVTEPETRETKLESSSCGTQEAPEDTPSVAASAPIYTDATRGRKSKKKANRSSLSLGDEESVISAPITRDELDETTTRTKDQRHNSLLGLSEALIKQDVPEQGLSEEAPILENLEDFEEPKKRSKKSKGRKGKREIEDIDPSEVNGGVDGDGAPMDLDKKGRRPDSGFPEYSGRISQDLPAKVSTPASIGCAPSSATDDWLTYPEDRDDAPNLDAQPGTTDGGPPIDSTERDHNEDTRPLSFLGMRREIPPPPDIPLTVEPIGARDMDRRQSSPLFTEPLRGYPPSSTSLPNSPTRRADGQAERVSELQKAGNNQSPLVSPSSTAIPFHFRVPPASPGVARSSPSAPQTPSTPDTLPSRPKLRPRSTEFKSSNEFRPLWLVERHGPKQEPTLEEPYPSLPSSHTTSRSSSVRDPDEAASDRSEFYDTIEYYGEDGHLGDGLLIDIARASTDTGLLDSQQTTPTAASFPTVNDAPSQQATGAPRGFAPSQHVTKAERDEEVPPQSSKPSSVQIHMTPESSLPSLGGITLGAVLGASAAGSLLAAKHEENKSRTQVCGSMYDERLQMNGKQEPGTKQKLSQDVDDFMRVSEGHSIEDGSGRKSLLDFAAVVGDESARQALETKARSMKPEVETLTAAQQREIQEQDAQDAVDSWFTPVSPKKSSADKSGKRRRRTVASRTESKDVLPSATPMAQQVKGIDFMGEETALREALRTEQQRETLVAPISEPSEILPKEMPVEEDVNVMSSVAGTTQDGISVGAPTQTEDPLLIEQEWPTKTKKGKIRSGKKSRKTSLVPGQLGFSDPTIEGDDKISVDPIVDEPQSYVLEEANPIHEDDSFRDIRTVDTNDQTTQDLEVSRGPGERRAELKPSSSNTKEGKKGKKRSKQIYKPEIEPAAAPDNIQKLSNDVQDQEIDLESVDKDVQPDTESNMWTDTVARKKSKKGRKEHNSLPIDEQVEASVVATESQSLQRPAQQHAAKAEIMVDMTQALPTVSDLEDSVSPKDIPLPREEYSELRDLSESTTIETPTLPSAPNVEYPISPEDIPLPREEYSELLELSESSTVETQALPSAPDVEDPISPEDIPLPREEYSELFDLSESNIVAEPTGNTNGTTMEEPSGLNFRGDVLDKQPSVDTPPQEPTNATTNVENLATHSPLQDLIAEVGPTYPEVVKPGRSEDKYANEFVAFPVKKDLRGRESKQNQPTEISVNVISEEPETAPVTVVLQPADHLKVLEHEHELKPSSQDRSVDANSRLSKQDYNERKERSHIFNELQPSPAQRAGYELENVDASDPLIQRTKAEMVQPDEDEDELVRTELEPMPVETIVSEIADVEMLDFLVQQNGAELVQPDEVEFPPTELHRDKGEVMLPEPALTSSEIPRNDIEVLPLKMGEAVTDPAQSSLLQPDEIEEPGSMSSRPEENAVAEMQKPQNDASQAPTPGISTSDAKDTPAYQDASGAEAVSGSLILNVKAPATDDAAQDDDIWEPPLKKKKGKKSKRSSLAEVAIPSYNASEVEGEPTAPALPNATADAAQIENDTVSSQAVDQSEVSGLGEFSQRKQEADFSERALPAVLEAQLEEDEWDGGYKTKSRKGKKGKPAKLPTFAEVDPPDSLSVAAVAVTNTAQEVEGMLQSEYVPGSHRQGMLDARYSEALSVPKEESDAVVASGRELSPETSAESGQAEWDMPKGKKGKRGKKGRNIFAEESNTPDVLEDPMQPSATDTFAQVEVSGVEPVEDSTTKKSKKDRKGKRKQSVPIDTLPTITVAPEATETIADRELTEDPSGEFVDAEAVPKQGKNISPTAQEDPYSSKHDPLALATDEPVLVSAKEVTFDDQWEPSAMAGDDIESHQTDVEPECPLLNRGEVVKPSAPDLADPETTKDSIALTQENPFSTEQPHELELQPSSVVSVSERDEERAIATEDFASGGEVAQPLVEVLSYWLLADVGKSAKDNFASNDKSGSQFTVKKEKKKTNKSKALGWEDKTTSSPADDQGSQGISDVQQGPSPKPTHFETSFPEQDDAMILERDLKRKKDKKRRKKSSMMSWEESMGSSEPQTEQVIERKVTAEIDIASMRDTAEEPPPSIADDFVATPKGKKDKKKATNAKSLGLDEDVGSALPKPEMDIAPQQELVGVPGQSVADNLEDGVRSKKARKKGKKAPFSSLEDNLDDAVSNSEIKVRHEPDFDSTPVRADSRVKLDEPVKQIARDVTGVLETAPEIEEFKEAQVPFKTSDGATTRTDNDHHRESQEESKAIDDHDQIKRGYEEASTGPARSLVEEFESVPKGKKDRKKAKKSKTLSWDDEPDLAAPERNDGAKPRFEESPTVAAQETPIQVGLAEPSTEPVKDVVEELEKLPKSKNDRKKAKKSKVFSWADEPESAVPEQAYGAHLTSKEGSDLAIPNASLEVEIKEPFTEPARDVAEELESAPKSKKDKKKAKKSKAISWAEEPETLGPNSEAKAQQESKEDRDAPLLQHSLEKGSTEIVTEGSEYVVGDDGPASQNKKAKDFDALTLAADTMPISSQAESFETSTLAPDQSSESRSSEKVDGVFEQSSLAEALVQPFLKASQLPKEVEASDLARPESQRSAVGAKALDEAPLEATARLHDNAELVDQPAFQSERSADEAEDLNRSVSVTDPPQVERKAFEHPIFEPEQPSLPTTLLEQPTSKAEREPIPEMPENPHKVVTAIEQIAPASEADIEEQVFEPDLPFKTSLLKMNSLNDASSRKDHDDLDIAERAVSAENTEEQSMPSVVPSLTPAYDPLASQKVGHEFELDPIRSSEKLQQDEQAEDGTQTFDMGEGVAESGNSSSFFEGQHTAATLPIQQTVEKPLPPTASALPRIAEEDPIAQTPDLDSDLDAPYSLKKSKKDKKKQKKAKASDPGLEIGPADRTTEDSSRSVDPSSPSTRDEYPMAQTPEIVPDHEASYGFGKSRKDKKKTRKAKILDVEEEIAQSAPQVIGEILPEHATTEDVLQKVEESIATGTRNFSTEDFSKSASRVGDIAVPEQAITEDVPQTVEVPLPTGAGDFTETAEVASTGERASEHVPKATYDTVFASTSPEHPHKRGFFEDVGPEVALEEEKAIEPPWKAKRTDQSSPPSQKIVEMEEEVFSMAKKKSKKSKQAKKSAYSSVNLEEEELVSVQPEPPLSQPPVSSDKNFVSQNEQELGKPVLEQPLVEGAKPPNAEAGSKGTIENSAAAERATEPIAELVDDGDAWDVPVKKGRKENKKRKEAVRIQSESEIVEAGSPFAATPVNGLSPGTPAADDAVQRAMDLTTTDIPGPAGVQNLGLVTDSADRVIPFSGDVEGGSTAYIAGEGPIPLRDQTLDIREHQSAKGLPVGDEDSIGVINSTKKSKKDRKAKKKQQPIVWEDDNSTASGPDKADLYADLSAPLTKDVQKSITTRNEQETVAFSPITNIPTNEYTALEPESSCHLDRTSPYFSKSTGEVRERDPREQPLYGEIVEEQGKLDPELLPSTEDLQPIQGEQMPMEPRTRSRERILPADDQTREVGFASEARHGNPDVAQFNVESNVSETGLAAGMVLSTSGRAENDGTIVSTSKAKKGKKSKKRDPTVEDMIPSNEARPDRTVSGLDSISRSTSQAPPADFEDKKLSWRGDFGAKEALAAAGALGADVAVAEGLTRRGSKKPGKKDKKSKKNKWAGDDDEEAEPKPGVDDVQQTPPTGPVTTPPRSPRARSPTFKYVGLPEEQPHTERMVNRDSAVHVSDSPIIPDSLPVHREVRDSGYQDTEASPVVDHGHENKAPDRGQEGTSTDPSLETIDQSGKIRMEEDPMLRPRTASRGALNISLDVDSNHAGNSEASLERNRAQGAPMPNTDLPRGLDTTCLAYDDPHEPSPVSSTTKDRSSILFESSPSIREVRPDPPVQLQSPLRAQSPLDHDRALSPTFIPSPIAQAHQQPHQSLFGGPTSHDSDVISPPRTPIAFDDTPHGGLNTISEYSPEESPLQKKGRRSLSDVGSPERGNNSRRHTQRQIRSPPLPEHPAKDMVSTDDIISRLSWPAVDEEKHAVDLERSRSRTTDRQASGRQSVVSASSIPPKPVEGATRSFSGASIRSGESINAIIRTPPDTVRSASGLGFRNSATPPLRRVDRSVSGDLRQAAKKRASTSEAAASSSSTSNYIYDTSEDKGKGRAGEMADVYVSSL